LKKANGAVFSAITTRDFDEPTIMPSTSAITQFENIISPIFDKIHKICIESRRLAELRDTLLPKLMSGEINVNNL
jgi:type I restriction enzyme S subunit